MKRDKSHLHFITFAALYTSVRQCVPGATKSPRTKKQPSLTWAAANRSKCNTEMNVVEVPHLSLTGHAVSRRLEAPPADSWQCSARWRHRDTMQSDEANSFRFIIVRRPSYIHLREIVTSLAYMYRYVACPVCATVPCSYVLASFHPG